MGWFHRKPDPIGDRERELNSKLEALEGQIQDLRRRTEEEQRQPKLRSTARPHGPSAAPGAQGLGGQLAPDPGFEDVSRLHPRRALDPEATPLHYNELGVRKYDLVAALGRLLDHFRRHPDPNPKLVNYLAAGSLHGLRPLRYEKRVARNRFIGLVVLFIAIIWGMIKFYSRNR